MSEVISKIIPIIMLVGLGYYIQLKKLADKQSVATIKKAIVNIALPAVIFIAFKNMELKIEYLIISLVVIAMLTVFYISGTLVNKIASLKHVLLPFTTTAYSFGLLTLPLFGAVYGIENLGIISIFGIGHEIFAWFVYLTLIRGKFGGYKFSYTTIKNFLKSPIIIMIILGLFFNITGFNKYFSSNFILSGIERTILYIASTATPVILIVVGFGLKLEHSFMKVSIKLVVVRLFIMLTIGYIFKFLVINPIIGSPSKLFNIAYFTFLISPPPFSLAIFIGEYSSEENMAIANNTTVISTALCIFIFLIATFIV